MPSPRYTREIPARFRLEGAKCNGCGKIAYPARRICADCRGEDWSAITLSPRGKVLTCTVIHTPPAEFTNEAPFAMALIETPEGARMMLQVVDIVPQDVKPGLEVKLEFRLVRREGHSGILCYGHKAVPAELPG